MLDISPSFGNAVRKRRLELKLSQEELAEIAGLHRTYVADIERGTRNVSLKNLVKLIHALDISLSEFFSKYASNLNSPNNKRE